MLFANARVYTVKLDTPITNEVLEKHKAREPGPMETHAQGWVPPFGKESDKLLEQIGDVGLITLRTSKRRLPGKVVKEAVSAKVDEIEKRDGRKVYRTERNAIKEQVLAELLPRAFVEHRHISAMLLPGYIVINATSETAAMDVLNLLRECNETLPVRPLNVRIPPYSLMTDWLRAHAAPGNLRIGSDCLLQDTDRGQIRIRDRELDSEEVRSHLQAGMIVERLSLEHMDLDSFTSVYFELDDKLVLRKISYVGLAEIQAEDAYEELQGTLAIAGDAMANLLSELVTSFGGIDDSTVF